MNELIEAIVICQKFGVSNLMGIVPLKITKKTDFKKYKVVIKGDFVYNPMRVDVGSIGLYEEETPAITSPDYVVFSVKDQQILSPHVLLKYLKSKRGLSQIGTNTVGSVRKRLYFSNLCKVEIPKIGTNKNKKIDNIVRKINIVLEILEMNKVDIVNLNSALLYKMLVKKEFI